MAKKNTFIKLFKDIVHPLENTKWSEFKGGMSTLRP